MLPEQALAIGNERRLKVAALRRRVREGQLKTADLLNDPPDALLNLSVFEVMLFARETRGCGSCRRQIGADALRDQINVLIHVGEASQRTLRWAAQRAPVRNRPRVAV